MSWVRFKYVDADYTKWLGANYEVCKTENCSTYICNHVGYADPTAIWCALSGKVTYLAAAHTKNIPLYGTMIQQSEGIFCPRGDP